MNKRVIKTYSDRELADLYMFEALSERFFTKLGLDVGEDIKEKLSELLNLVHDVSYERGSSNPYV